MRRWKKNLQEPKTRKPNYISKSFQPCGAVVVRLQRSSSVINNTTRRSFVKSACCCCGEEITNVAILFSLLCMGSLSGWDSCCWSLYKQTVWEFMSSRVLSPPFHFSFPPCCMPAQYHSAHTGMLGDNSPFDRTGQSLFVIDTGLLINHELLQDAVYLQVIKQNEHISILFSHITNQQVGGPQTPSTAWECDYTTQSCTQFPSWQAAADQPGQIYSTHGGQVLSVLAGTRPAANPNAWNEGYPKLFFFFVIVTIPSTHLATVTTNYFYIMMSYWYF